MGRDERILACGVLLVHLAGDTPLRGRIPRQAEAAQEKLAFTAELERERELRSAAAARAEALRKSMAAETRSALETLAVEALEERKGLRDLIRDREELER